ncbi:MAG: hypothetical protein EXS37_13360 [Opitutus sp.]|nr:hypothetical protein [Opitutus sp.]
MKRGLSCSVVLLIAIGIGAGCSSSQMSRIDRNRNIYETWPIETKQAVLDGKVEPGMNPDMVRVAWGEPSEVAVSPAGDEIWVYSKGGDPGSVIYPGGGVGGMGGGNIGMGGTGTGIGISTGRGGTSIGTSGGIGIGGGIGGGGIGSTGIGGIGGMGGMGGAGSPIMTRPTPPDIREVVFRNGVVVRADSNKP